MVRKPVEITTLHAAHVDASMPTIPLKAYPGLGTSALGRLPRMHLATGAHAMFYATAALAIAAGLFYSARLHELGGFGAALCRYGSMLFRKAVLPVRRCSAGPGMGYLCVRTVITKKQNRVVEIGSKEDPDVKRQLYRHNARDM
jgi:hypothetical protein